MFKGYGKKKLEALTKDEIISLFRMFKIYDTDLPTTFKRSIDC